MTFDEYIESSTNSDAEDRQTIYLLKGYSYKELGQTAAAKQVLQEAFDLDNTSEIGKAAKNILNMM